MKHFFYYRFSPSPSVRTVLRYISAMDMKPLFHSVMRNKRKSPVRYYSCSDDVFRILPIQPDVSCFAYEKESDCLFPLSCAFKAAKARERIWETVVCTFPLCRGRPCIQIIRRFSF